MTRCSNIQCRALIPNAEPEDNPLCTPCCVLLFERLIEDQEDDSPMPILDPFTVGAMLAQLSAAEMEELNRFSPARKEETEAEARQFLQRTSEWLIAWRARRLGGGVG